MLIALKIVVIYVFAACLCWLSWIVLDYLRLHLVAGLPRLRRWIVSCMKPRPVFADNVVPFRRP